MFRGCSVSTASQTKPFWSIDQSSLKNRRSSDRVREKVLDWSSVRDGMNRERCFGTIENKKAFWSWVDSKVGPFMIKFEAKKFARKNLNEAKNKNKNEIRHFKFPTKNSGVFFSWIRSVDDSPSRLAAFFVFQTLLGFLIASSEFGFLQSTQTEALKPRFQTETSTTSRLRHTLK